MCLYIQILIKGLPTAHEIDQVHLDSQITAVGEDSGSWSALVSRPEKWP